jgi:hypothetical protein
MADVFISFARDDAKTAQRLKQALSRFGLSVFFDQDVLVGGADFTSAMADALRSARAVVVLLSASTRRGQWVQEEMASALEQKPGPLLVPVLLDRHAKDNWVWPLLANRPAIELTDRPDDLDTVASTLGALLNAKAPAVSPQLPYEERLAPATATGVPPASSGRRHLALVLAAVVTIVVMVATFLLPVGNEPGSAPDHAALPTLWLVLGAGAAGVLVGYLLRKWRE